MIEIGRHVYIKEGRLAHHKGKVIGHLKDTALNLYVVRLFKNAGELCDDTASLPESYLRPLLYSEALSTP